MKCTMYHWKRLRVADPILSQVSDTIYNSFWCSHFTEVMHLTVAKEELINRLWLGNKVECLVMGQENCMKTICVVKMQLWILLIHGCESCM